MDKKQAYQDKLQAQLDEWAAEIDGWRAKADKAKADAQLKYIEEIDDLSARQKKARARMDELQKAQVEAWTDVTKGVEAACGV